MKFLCEKKNVNKSNNKKNLLNSFVEKEKKSKSHSDCDNNVYLYLFIFTKVKDANSSTKYELKNTFNFYVLRREFLNVCMPIILNNFKLYSFFAKRIFFFR